MYSALGFEKQEFSLKKWSLTWILKIHEKCAKGEGESRRWALQVERICTKAQCERANGLYEDLEQVTVAGEE